MYCIKDTFINIIDPDTIDSCSWVFLISYTYNLNIQLCAPFYHLHCALPVSALIPSSEPYTNCTTKVNYVVLTFSIKPLKWLNLCAKLIQPYQFFLSNPSIILNILLITTLNRIKVRCVFIRWHYCFIPLFPSLFLN